MPSERTIETLTNHALLEIINSGRTAPPFAWVFVPTQLDEAFLAYDAGLQAFKELYIQYKSRNQTGSFTFEFRQIWQLCSYLPRFEQAYVFLAGNHSPGYGQIAADHEAGGRYNSFNRTFFLDAWAVVDELVRTYTAGICVVPNLLPPPTEPFKGSVTLRLGAGGNMEGEVKIDTNLEAALQNLCSQLGYGGGPNFDLINPIPTSGTGVAFANDILACTKGRPRALRGLRRPIDNLDRQIFERSRMSVLAAPMG